MKLSKKLAIFAAAVFALTLSFAAPRRAHAEKSAAELEKEKALANPYPNDFGPDKLSEEQLKEYPKDKLEGYKLMLTRCSQCHTPSRPLNSRFVEPAAGLKAAVGPAREKAEDAAIAGMKKEHEDWFGEKANGIVQIESGVWGRYVKRMLNKPGCGVSQGGPYFHDGRAATLREVFSRYRHQLPVGLPEPELADLLEFLRGL